MMYTSLCPVVQPLKAGASLAGQTLSLAERVWPARLGRGCLRPAKIIGCLGRAARVKMELISPLAEGA